MGPVRAMGTIDDMLHLPPGEILEKYMTSPLNKSLFYVR